MIIRGGENISPGRDRAGADVPSGACGTRSASGSRTRSTASWSAAAVTLRGTPRTHAGPGRALPGAPRGVQGAGHDPRPGRRSRARRPARSSAGGSPSSSPRPRRGWDMRFAVLGAGAIGAYVGAALARGGADVTLIARGPHLAAMPARGVRVLSPRGDFTARPAATGDLAAVAGADVVFVALKAYSLPGIAPRLGDAARARAPRRSGRRTASRGGTSSRCRTGRLAGTVCESVDPGGVIARSIRPGAQRRLRRLLLDRDHRARGDPPHRGHPVHPRRAGRVDERAVPADLRRRSPPAA